MIWQPWYLRMIWNQRGERFSRWLAWLLPRQVALWAFVRVCASSGDEPSAITYESAYKAWERGAGR